MELFEIVSDLKKNCKAGGKKEKQKRGGGQKETSKNRKEELERC